MDQRQLARTLEAVVGDAVNAVGVDLNTASAPLLAHVAGLGPSLAQNIVAYRDAGRLPVPPRWKKVAGLGPRAFEQCAGFLRIRDGKEPLDASSVRSPRAYGVARRIVAACGATSARSWATAPLKGIRAEAVRGRELRPADDPRHSGGTGKSPAAIPGQNSSPPALPTGSRISRDLHARHGAGRTPPMWPPFGAFVDIGVHQDGLVHIDQLADRFVRTRTRSSRSATSSGPRDRGGRARKRIRPDHAARTAAPARAGAERTRRQCARPLHHLSRAAGKLSGSGGQGQPGARGAALLNCAEEKLKRQQRGARNRGRTGRPFRAQFSGPRQRARSGPARTRPTAPAAARVPARPRPAPRTDRQCRPWRRAGGHRMAADAARPDDAFQHPRRRIRQHAAGGNQMPTGRHPQRACRGDRSVRSRIGCPVSQPISNGFGEA